MTLLIWFDPTDFHIFPTMKKQLTGHHFDTDDDANALNNDE